MRFLKQFLRRNALLLAALLLGAYGIGSALWELGKTAIYTHKSVVLPGVVTDVRQRPFETQTEAWEHGNLCAADATAYQPFVTFTLPDGITINKAMPDMDCDDYTLHQAVEIITHPHDPNQAHIYKAKFLCGWSLMKLAGGIVLFLPAVLLLHKRRKHQRLKKKMHPAPVPPTKKARTREASRQEPGNDDSFSLVAPDPTPEKKKRTRKQSATTGEKKAPAKRKKSATVSTVTSRRRKSTKKNKPESSSL